MPPNPGFVHEVPRFLLGPRHSRFGDVLGKGAEKSPGDQGRGFKLYSLEIYLF
jgi:hypothetical protein